MARAKRSSSGNKYSRYSLRKSAIRQAGSQNTSTTNGTGKRRRVLSKKTSSTATAKRSPSRKKYGPSQNPFPFPFPFPSNPLYRTWAGSRLDDRRVRRDNKSARMSRKRTLANLQARFPQRSTDAQPIVDNPTISGILGLDRSKEAKDIYLSNIERKSIAALERDYPLCWNLQLKARRLPNIGDQDGTTQQSDLPKTSYYAT